MRLNLVLLWAVVASALYLVHVQYQSRNLYAELHKAQAQSKRLAQERERLELERRAQATPARIESLARTQLQMRPASPAVTTYITLAADDAGSATVVPVETRAANPGKRP